MCLFSSSELYPCSRNCCLSSLQWCSKYFDFVKICLIYSAWLYGILFCNNFGCFVFMWRKLCRSVCIHKKITVSIKKILVSEILYWNSTESCFAFNSSKFLITCFLLPAHVKNISSINLKSINEIPCKYGDIRFLPKWSINIFA